MTNPFNRGSAPDRARDPWQNPATFEPGHAKLGGRKKGTRNVITPEHKMALLEAVHRVGYDGNGKDGAFGYFRWVATRDLTFFYVNIWMRLLDLEVYEAAIRAQAPCITNASDDQKSRSTRTKKTTSFELPRGGPNAEVEGLMRLAMEQPKVFSKLFCAVLLTPPKNWRTLAQKAGLLVCDTVRTPRGRAARPYT
jgi:hypothetical protein